MNIESNRLFYYLKDKRVLDKITVLNNLEKTGWLFSLAFGDCKKGVILIVMTN